MNLFKRVSLLMILASPLAAFAESANNKISMVTFFPVPYVAYNRVNATEEMDIGLRSCNLTLGSTGSTNQPLSVTNTKVTSGNLALNNASAVNVQNQLSLGIPNRFGPATLKFKNLYVGSVSNGGSVNTDSMVVNGLSLFNRNFPSCVAKVSSGQIAWASLALGPNPDKKEIFLTCGGDQTCNLVARANCETGSVCVADDSFMVGLQQGYTGQTMMSWLSAQEQATGTPFVEILNQQGPNALKAILQGTYGGDDWAYRVVLCGPARRVCSCNVENDPPAWQWGGVMDYSSCQAKRVRSERVFKSCSDYFTEMGTTALNGYTVIGDVMEVETWTKGGNGACSNSVNLDFSQCKAYKFGWGSKQLYQGNDYTPNYYFNDRFHYATWLSTAPSCYFTHGTHAICTPPELYNNSCAIGYENPDDANATCNFTKWMRGAKRYSRQADDQSPKVTATCYAAYQCNHNPYAPDYYRIPMRSDYSFSGTMGGINVQKCNRYYESCSKICKKINVNASGQVTGLTNLESNECPIQLQVVD